MSHYLVIVAVPSPAHLADALAPFSEGIDVPPYRDYYTDWRKAYKRAAKFFRDNPEDRPAGLDEKDVAAVLAAYNSDDVHEDSSSGERRYYTMSTYNPDSKWDWWEVGGRFSGLWLPTEPGNPSLLPAAPDWNTPEDMDPMAVNGGPKRLLDLEGARNREGKAAADRWDTFHAIAAKYPEAHPWSRFWARHEADPEGYPAARARSDYWAQPLKQALDNFPIGQSWTCPIDEYTVDREVYVARNRAAANTGYALLTLDGEWIAPGEMGWWGFSSDEQEDRDAYREKANAYLDVLDSDIYLIAVDCHI